MGNAQSGQPLPKWVVPLKKLFDKFFANKQMRVVMLGLDAAGKTTILYKLHIGEVLSTVPTIGALPSLGLLHAAELSPGHRL